MSHISACPNCGKNPNRWLGEECELFLGHCGITCEGVPAWEKYAAAMELAMAEVVKNKCRNEVNRINAQEEVPENVEDVQKSINKSYADAENAIQRVLDVWGWVM